MPTEGGGPRVSYTSAETDFHLPPEQERGRNRSLAIACAALAAVAVLGLLWLLFGRSEPPASQSPQAAAAARVPLPEQTRATYAPPSQAQVAHALADVGRTYRSGGASELARASRACFDRLRERPDYAQLDYCLAFDSFAASEISRLAEMDLLPTESWFGRAPQRGFQVAQAVLGPQGDAAARLIDIRRLALNAGRGTRYAQVATTPVVTVPLAPAQTAPLDEVQQLETPRPAPRSTPVSPSPSRADPTPAPVPVRVATPPARREEVLARVTPAPRREVARADGGARPSFNCRYARSRSERLVCRDADLAAMDRELNRAFEDAVASGVSRRALRAEQDSWLAVRESAAGDPAAVSDIYALRIEELRDAAREPDYEDD